MLIEKLVFPALIEDKQINWAVEVKTAKELFTYCPEEEFWLKCFNLDFNLRSLVWLKSKRGMTEVRKQYSLFRLTQKKSTEIKLEDKPVIKIQIEEKTDNIIDYIDFKKGNNI